MEEKKVKEYYDMLKTTPKNWCPLPKVLEKVEIELPINTGSKYTYADYLTWDDDKRREIIYGSVYMMAAPSNNHQRVLVEMTRQLANYLQDKTCEVYAAPFDVRLSADPNVDDKDDKKTDTEVVQPDITVVCDPEKLHPAGCLGAPDFIVEILSPSSASKDCVAKFNAYQDAGVKEYWIVDMAARILNVFTLENGHYVSQKYLGDAKVKVGVLDDCYIDMGLAYSKIKLIY